MLDDFNWKVMEKDLEGLARRFKATSRNIANANTPGYARRNVSFEDQLRDIIRSGDSLKMTVTHPGHIPTRPHVLAGVTPVELKITDEVYRLDGNNVDPEREMAVLAETRMMYGAMTRLTAKKASTYRSVISGR
ncbi:MAG: flagellar basal body rod protein FlgB [Synergistaceae bacterium]|nr:flagellar basal body rod protein FlgB [Synergistaceae bacterium]